MEPSKNGLITTLGNPGDYQAVPCLDPLGGLGNGSFHNPKDPKYLYGLKYVGFLYQQSVIWLRLISSILGTWDPLGK